MELYFITANTFPLQNKRITKQGCMKIVPIQPSHN